TGDHECRSVWTELRLEETPAATAGARYIPQHMLGENATRRLQKLAHRADVDIAILVKHEVSTRKGAVLTYRLVDNRQVRRNLLLIDDPVERWSRSVGAIGREALGLQAQP